MTSMTQVTQDLGNTKPSPIRIRNRKWCITLNNYTSEEYDAMTQYFSSKKYKYIIGKEMGENKTPHLQIYVEHTSDIYFDTIKKLFPRVHMEKARGNRDQNVDYCSKEGNFVCNGLEKKMSMKEKAKLLVLKRYENIVWKDWQQNLIDLINKEPDDRTINWIHEEKGNIGKSFLCKYIVCKYDAIIADGKKDNIFNQVNIHMDNDKLPTIIILDIPRHNVEYINYGVLEQLKNGMIYSGKYEGGVCIFPPPHVLVFCNVAPDTSHMSEDRWNIIYLG